MCAWNNSCRLTLKVSHRGGGGGGGGAAKIHEPRDPRDDDGLSDDVRTKTRGRDARERYIR